MSQRIGKYALYESIGSGGMGSVYLGRLFGSGGFRRIVAIKRLHSDYATDAAFIDGFLDEARLASRIHHPNVVAPLDVVSAEGEVFLVFEHILGVSLSSLLRRARREEIDLPPAVVAAILVDMLSGLHAAHEAESDTGEPLGLVHRDISPQNIMVGADGMARILDFGIAKADGRAQQTADGVLKGKLTYMAPEQFSGNTDRRTDLYAAAIVLWEAMAERKLFDDTTSIPGRIHNAFEPPPLNHPFDAIVRRALAFAPDERYADAHEMAAAIEAVERPASRREVADWLAVLVGEELTARSKMVKAIESAETPSSDPSENTSSTAVLLRSEPPLPLASSKAAAGQADDTEISAVQEVFLVAKPAPASRWRAVVGVALVLVIACVVVLLRLRGEPSVPVVAESPSTPTTAGAAARIEPPLVEAPSAAAAGADSLLPAASAEPAVPVEVKPEAKKAVRPSKRPKCEPYTLDKTTGRKLFNEKCL